MTLSGKDFGRNYYRLYFSPLVRAYFFPNNCPILLVQQHNPYEGDSFHYFPLRPRKDWVRELFSLPWCEFVWMRALSSLCILSRKKIGYLFFGAMRIRCHNSFLVPLREKPNKKEKKQQPDTQGFGALRIRKPKKVGNENRFCTF
jgi:hypothetical protein